MNAMKRFLLGSGQQSGSTESSPGMVSGVPQQTEAVVVGIRPSPSQHAALSLTHLRKLFSDYSGSIQPSTVGVLTESERESRLYAMLPLFCRVFSHCPPAEMLDKFPEVPAFCQQVSRLAVSEIRRRASNQSTVAASQSIAGFLEMDPSCGSADDSASGSGGNGWMLLSCMNLLSSGGPGTGLIEVMTAASVPSTLVKCLYLFFDLPDVVPEESGPEAPPTRDSFSAWERRVLLQKAMGQMLVRLAGVPAAAEELARKDDLSLLFSALSSWCPAHNLPWRKSANEVTVALTRHGLTGLVLAYIHNKGCISLCVENMQKASADLSPLELVEMFATVFCLLKDSTEVTQTLLDDFRAAQGYHFLTDFLLRAEADSSTESQEALRNLVFLISSLSQVGFTEIRPAAGSGSTGSLFQLPGFSVPQPSGKGSSVRNVMAFQVLHNAFLKSGSSILASIILDAVSTLLHSDPANYFILETQSSLSQFAERIHLKSAQVQEKFFRVLEFVVFQLNYVPCKELVSLSLLLRNHSAAHPKTAIHCLLFLLTCLRHHPLFKDVYREVGLLEVLVTCLQRFSALPRLKSNPEPEDPELELGYLVMECLAVLLPGSGGNNAAIFRESGGARIAHGLIPLPKVRREALGLVQQLILSAGGDEDMGALLGLLQAASSPSGLMPDLSLKMDILKSLLTCLRESHRTRTMFRKVGGFVYIMSALVSMEGCLAVPGTNRPEGQLRLLHLIFNTLCISMRYEPANAKFFLQEICGPSLCDTIRLLGCFHLERSFDSIVPLNQDGLKEHQEFHKIFNKGVQDYCASNEGDVDESIPPGKRQLFHATLVLRLLYDLAVDSYDRSQTLPSCCSSPAPPKSPTVSPIPPEGSAVPRSESGSTIFKARPLVSGLSLNQPHPVQPDPILVHPGVVLAMFRLLPSIWIDSDVESSVSLQLLVTDIIQSLMANSERNVQILCEAGLAAELLNRASGILDDESHYLHSPLVTVLEHLGRQALEPKELRGFLRLGSPLNCLLPAEGSSGSPLPLHRLRSLVSMAIPRDVVAGSFSSGMIKSGGSSGFKGINQRSLFSPPFVEFDMQPEGFGCLYLPSVAPQSQSQSGSDSTPSGGAGSGASGVMGGVGGGGDRVFPASTGMSYSTWICVDKFSDPRLDPHGIRLLTLVRTVNLPESGSIGSRGAQPSTDSEAHLVCLSVMLSPRDKALLVSTQEMSLPKGSSDWEPDVSGDSGARIWNPDLIQEGQWHHLALVWSRAVLKSSQFSLYVDGQLVHTGKMHYISQNPGGGAATLTVASSVYGYIGTAPSWRRQSRLVWRQGPCHLVEDALGPQTVQWIYRIGPHYAGSLQAPELPLSTTSTSAAEKLISSVGSAVPLPVSSPSVSNSPTTGSNNPSEGSSNSESGIGGVCSLVNEERIVFGLNASAQSPLTLAKIRKVYRKTDSRSIAKQLGISTHENATPIRLLHNAAGHLAGPARTLGGVVIGYLGVRVFCPRPLCTTLQSVGGSSVLLGMVAMATDQESLASAVQTLVSVLRSSGSGSGEIRHEMERLRGYQTFAYLLKQHSRWLDRNVLQLVLSLVGCQYHPPSAGSTKASISWTASPLSNSLAFRDLLADLDIWRIAGPEEAEEDLLKILLDLFYRLASDPSAWASAPPTGPADGQAVLPGSRSGGLGGGNTRYLRELNLVGRLIRILQESHEERAESQSSRETTLWSLMGWLLHNNPRPVDLLQFGQFLAGTLPISGPSIENDPESLLDDSTPSAILSSRNDGLSLLLKLFLVHDKGVNQLFAEEFLRVLGFDWLLLFAQPQIRPSSVILSIRCLVLLLSCPPVLNKFRTEGVGISGPNGAFWTRSKEALMTALSQNHPSIPAVASVASGPLRLVGRTFSVAEEVQSTLMAGAGNNQPLQPGHVHGFQLLSWLLINHIQLPEVYHLIIGLMVGKTQPRTTNTVDMEAIWSCIFGVQPGSPATVSIASLSGSRGVNGVYCPEAVSLLFSQIRALMNPEESEKIISAASYPDVLLQFLFHLYSNSTDYAAVFITPDVLTAMTACFFPPTGGSSSSTAAAVTASEPGTPIDDSKQYVLMETSGNSGSKDQLTSHPAKKRLMDFLRTILVDSLSLPALAGTLSSTSSSTGNSSKSESSNTGNNPQPTLDVVLDGCPESANYAQHCQFQSELLSTLMDYLSSAGTVLGDQSVLPIAPGGGSVQHIAPNIFYLAGRLVDKLWQGILNPNGVDPQAVFDFIVQLINQARRRSSSSGGSNSASSSSSLSTAAMDNIFRVLNRCILYLLSRPIGSSNGDENALAGQMSVLETLRKLTTHRSLVLGSGNHDLEFIGSLTYCLLQLTHMMPISTDPVSRTTWHLSEDSGHSGLRESQHLVSTAAQRVWEELYISKKPAIEEAFKISLGANTQSRAPGLEVVREPATKLWLTYVEAERRSAYRTVLEVNSTPNQLFTSKIQKVTGGLSRLTSRSLTLSKSKSNKSLIRTDNNDGVNKSPGKTGQVINGWPDVWISTQSNLSGLKELMEAERRQARLAREHAQQYSSASWAKIEENELLRSRGLWGPLEESKLLTKWMLDAAEAGPCRMRKKLTPNPHFYSLYPYRPELEAPENKSLRSKVAVSLDAKEHHRLFGSGSRWRRSLLIDPNDPVDQVDQTGSLLQAPTLQHQTSLRAAITASDDVLADQLKEIVVQAKSAASRRENMDEDEEPIVPVVSAPAAPPVSTQQAPQQDWQNLLRLLEENEKIGHLFRCARVQGLETVDGLLLFGKEHLYVVDGFTQTPGRGEIRDVSNYPVGTFEPIVPPYTTPGYGQQNSPFNRQQEAIKSSSVHQCSRLSYEDIREVHKRRYLLQPIALEIFSSDGRNHLLAFPPSARNKVYQRLLATATGLSDSASQSVAGQKRAANVEQSAGLLSTMTAGLMGETSVTQRWVRGELSNFQYLMHLNTLAGRSYNDLMQYPVFPWILADYDSPELDLSNPSTFRDLSKPMGAQTNDRLAQFKKRYKEWDDPHNETGPYHYGTHYSSAMIVCSYLVRLEPFTQQFLQLQGGHFDLADRLFHSIREAWSSAAQLNMADVKELIPEFFYLPEFLINGNRFDLGCKQSGVSLDDVVLPPWAKKDPREFIRLHRAALESDYVSSHLHEWIDLIFGYKQQGPAAVESVNLFHPLFYEGNVDIYSIQDPLKKNAVIGFINNFGQTPKQLFKKPHPAKKVAGSILDQGSSNRMSGALEMALPLAGQAIGQMLPVNLPGAGGNSPSGMDPEMDRIFFHHVDHLSPSLQPVKELKRAVGHMVGLDRSVILAVEENKCLIPPNYSRCIAWGFADHSLRLLPPDSETKALMVCETAFHQEILTCCAPTARTIITGGANTVVTVWDLGKRSLTVRQHLYGHTEAVTCLAASAGYQILVSGSRDRTAIVWDLSRLTFVRQLTGHTAPLAAISVNDLTGDIATCSGTWLHLWSINGEILASVNTLVGAGNPVANPGGRSGTQHILCVCFSQHNEWDPANVILTGSTDGVVRMWSLDYVQVPDDDDKPVLKESTPVKVSKESSKEVVDEPEERDHGKLERQDSLSNSESSEYSEENKEEDGQLRTSRSDTSLNGTGFEVITDSEVREIKAASNPAPYVPTKRSRHVLKEGFKWQRQLIFRTKLTMHTAYDRTDNSEPASITSIAISKDHRTVLVGDARGRVHSWSVTDLSGRSMADHWLRDEAAEACANPKCRARFTLTERRHHCRNCGHVFCSRCSRYESEIMQLRIRRPVRVCQGCYVTLKGNTSSDGTS